MTFPFPLFAKFSSLKIAFYMAVLLIIVILINNSSIWISSIWINQKKGIYEGFTQEKSFILKQDNDIYDDFYIEIYDILNSTIKRNEYDIDKIINITKLNYETAYILDVGCGTGCLVNEFIKKGIKIKGIDKSQNMINYANNKLSSLLQNETSLKEYSPIIYECMEAEDPIIYERSTFSHILCLYMTIYEIKDKIKFFRNAFYGLQPDGYLVLHLTKGDDYNGFIDLGKPKAIDEKVIIESGIKKLQTDFGGFTYKKDWTDIYSLKESFIDHKTHNIRQNELTWYYEPIDIIIEQCKRCGFNIYNNILEDKNIGGSLYFFRKPGILKK